MTLDEMRRGIEIFQKYLSKDEHLDGADHDVIFFAGRDLPLSDEDRAELESLGFLLSEEFDCWIHFA